LNSISRQHQAETQGAVNSAFKGAGLSDAAIRGINANIVDESGWNPTLRHPDQPHFGGEAHYAHGLFQEGGTEWNNYHKWLNGRDWRDPGLQAQFLVENIREHYKPLWKILSDPNVSASRAATAFVDMYLKPATRYRVSRDAKYRRLK